MNRFAFERCTRPGLGRLKATTASSMLSPSSAVTRAGARGATGHERSKMRHWIVTLTAACLLSMTPVLPLERTYKYDASGTLTEANVTSAQGNASDLVRSVNEDPARYRRDEKLPPGFVAWDVIAVFGTSAHWDHDLPVPVSYGCPVVDAIEVTRKAIADELAAATPTAR